MHNHVLRLVAFSALPCSMVALAGCDDRSGMADQVGAVANNEAVRQDVVDNPGQALPGAVRHLPRALLGAFATDPGGCRSDYGPLVVKPTQFEFGWGRADFSSIVREGNTYRIEAMLFGEGQPDGPERERYIIAPQADGIGIKLKMGGEDFDYEPCTGETSGVSVQTGKAESSALDQGRRGAVTSASAPADKPSRVPLTPGVYVLEGTTCENPANAAWRVWDGRGLSGSNTQACRAQIMSRSGDTFTLRNSCENTYDGLRTDETLAMTVTDQVHFSVKGQSFESCSMAQVPEELSKRVTG